MLPEAHYVGGISAEFVGNQLCVLGSTINGENKIKLGIGVENEERHVGGSP